MTRYTRRIALLAAFSLVAFAAIVDAANAYIDSEVASGAVTADDAVDLKTRVEDDLAFAIATSRTKTVAANLGITVAALNDGFSAARKALTTAKIDKALKNGDIDADQADELKSELDDASLPGYKSLGRGGGFDLGSYTGGNGSAEQQSQQRQRRGFHR